MGTSLCSKAHGTRHAGRAGSQDVCPLSVLGGACLSQAWGSWGLGGNLYHVHAAQSTPNCLGSEAGATREAGGPDLWGQRGIHGLHCLSSALNKYAAPQCVTLEPWPWSLPEQECAFDSPKSLGQTSSSLETLHKGLAGQQMLARAEGTSMGVVML